MKIGELLTILIISLLIAVLDRAAYSYHLYFTLWWFDIVMHFLGGILVALSALYVVRLTGKAVSSLRLLTLILITVGAPLVVGSLWEVFEIVIDSASPGNAAIDTTTDLIFDTVGAIVVLMYALSRRRKRRL